MTDKQIFCIDDVKILDVVGRLITVPDLIAEAIAHERRCVLDEVYGHALANYQSKHATPEMLLKCLKSMKDQAHD